MFPTSLYCLLNENSVNNHGRWKWRGREKMQLTPGEAHSPVQTIRQWWSSAAPPKESFSSSQIEQTAAAKSIIPPDEFIGISYGKVSEGRLQEHGWNVTSHEWSIWVTNDFRTVGDEFLTRALSSGWSPPPAPPHSGKPQAVLPGCAPSISTSPATGLIYKRQGSPETWEFFVRLWTLWENFSIWRNKDGGGICLWDTAMLSMLAWGDSNKGSLRSRDP